ncbi:MAG: Response regulator of zinc sigma-54-dependent two-component system [Firmicutes bacterium]|nr:Response regulator of zinc sigma-54-dependent two-component system [Bacillota bacterium]
MPEIKTTCQDVDYMAVLENLNTGICILDADGQIVYINEAYSEITGIPHSQLLGRSIYQLAKDGIFNFYDPSFIKSQIGTPNFYGRTFYEMMLEQLSQEKVPDGRAQLKLHSKISRSGYVRQEDGQVSYFYIVAYPIWENGKIKHIIINMYNPPLMRRFYQSFTDEGRYGASIVINDNKTIGANTLYTSTTKEMAEVYKVVKNAAKTDATILICGESGVGKEVIADDIYHNSRRVGKPYIKVNCASIPANLLESELFGYKGGAFTGANPKGKAGLFELANGGTILLDEIGDISYETQTKLLRVLQNKEVLRIGDTKTIQLDVRVIAATNAPLQERISQGTFREDLYYRLNVVPIHVPPLRKRKGDIPKLAAIFFDKFCEKHKREMHMSASFLHALLSYDWPGNIRELENAIEYMVICSENPFLSGSDLYTFLGINQADLDVEQMSDNEGLQAAMNAYEKFLIESAIKNTSSIRKAAAMLKVNPSTISRKVKQYGITVENK